MQIQQIQAEIAEIELKIEAYGMVLGKEFEDWTEEEKLEFGDHEELWEKRQYHIRKEADLREQKKQLRELETLKKAKEKLYLQGIYPNLTKGNQMNTNSTQFVRSKSAEEFIRIKNLDLHKPQDYLKYMEFHLEKVVNVAELPNNAAFIDNCLEYRLDRRTTEYNLDNVDNIKLLLAVSGAGKTRMLLELLYSNFGYYFTGQSSQKDFGSGDLALFRFYCDNNPQSFNLDHRIKQLYFVRAFVCNYLIENGFKEPRQILLAQLHPVAFFGIDLFHHLLKIILSEPLYALPKVKHFSFVAIDEVQVLVEGGSLYRFPRSANLRPFLSPLVYYSKMYLSGDFLICGTGMNFDFVKEIMESGTMKDNQRTRYNVVSNFQAMSRDEIESYATQFLNEHHVQDVDDIVSKILAFGLCHGRPRFLAWILDRYMKSKDIDLVISEFVSEITNVNGQMFPLRFYKRDLDNNIRSLNRIIAGDTLGRILRDGLLNLMMKGDLNFGVNENEGATAITYGLGFGYIDHGLLTRITIQEEAIVLCLRSLIPFASLVKDFANRLAECRNFQMVGYMVEYLVAFALVANTSGYDAAEEIESYQYSALNYILDGNPNQVCFPDQMCGPDIIYKCALTKTIYIVQIKFVKAISKQGLVNATSTTNPEMFYKKQKGDGVIRGFEERRINLRNHLLKLQSEGFSVHQMLFIHTGENPPSIVSDTEIVTKSSHPDYFNKIDSGIWDFLDSIRAKGL